jgi:stage III sporulation protein AG
VKWEEIGAIMKSGRGRAILLLAGAMLGVVLLLWGNVGGGAAVESAVSEDLAADTEAYARALERRIALFCGQVEGVGEVSVAVSLESGYRRIYAQEDSSYVLVGSGASRGMVYLTEEPPRLSGIAVVCEGGGDPTVRRHLIGLLSAAYGIGTNKIYIAEAQN